MADGRSERLLLDTHTFIWYVFGELRGRVVERLIGAAEEGGLLVSPITAWEIGLISLKDRSDAPKLNPNAAEWYRTALLRSGVIETPFDSAIALASTTLPGTFHRDPADRFLVATARARNVSLVTRDERILAYAAAGHVRAIPC